MRRGEDRAGNGPDFLIGNPPAKAVAVEVTELYLEDERDAGAGSPRREQEGLREAFVRRAEDAFYGREPTGRAANVFFHWLARDFGAGELAPKLVRELAPVAAALVSERFAGSEGALVQIDEDELRAAGLGRFLVSIQGRETRPYADGRASPWCSSGPSFYPAAVGVAAVERAMAGKESKLAAYRERCDEAWLLVAAMGGPSSFDGVNDAVLFHRFRSSFDRVVLFCPGAAPDRRVLMLVG